MRLMAGLAAMFGIRGGRAVLGNVTAATGGRHQCIVALVASVATRAVHGHRPARRDLGGFRMANNTSRRRVGRGLVRQVAAIAVAVTIQRERGHAHGLVTTQASRLFHFGGAMRGVATLAAALVTATGGRRRLVACAACGADVGDLERVRAVARGAASMLALGQ